jgi:glyceraldehyde-3-phosphate dehydrogenase/erythrose-4-phosphate dehydrogenase
MIWFDNEWAFVNRMVDIVLRLSDFVAEESSS